MGCLFRMYCRRTWRSATDVDHGAIDEDRIADIERVLAGIIGVIAPDGAAVQHEVAGAEGGIGANVEETGAHVEAGETRRGCGNGGGASDKVEAFRAVGGVSDAPPRLFSERKGEVSRLCLSE